MMWNYGYGMDGGLYFIMPFIWILFWILVIFIVWRVWAGWNKGSSWRGEKTPKDLLAERFAKGEIDEEEYKKRLEVLSKTT